MESNTRKTTDDLKQNLSDTLATLKTMRDEIRLDLHLAGADLRARFEKEMEPKLKDAERLAREATDKSRQALGEIVAGFKEFRQTLASIGKNKKA